MEAYTDFAKVYDVFMDETPYEAWSSFLLQKLKYYGVEGGLLVDLGCGTGTLTQIMAKAGYEMIGIDYSSEMLAIASEKNEETDCEILYLLQDMREFELYGTVKAIYSVCDSLNYLLDEQDLIATFRLVNNYLDPGGIFMFDFNTVYKYQTVIGDTVIAENREDCSFIWENFYDQESAINEYDLTIFVKSIDENKELFQKFTETHYQRGYTLEQMKGFVEQAGMTVLEVFDADTHEEVNNESERIYVITREQGK